MLKKHNPFKNGHSWEEKENVTPSQMWGQVIHRSHVSALIQPSVAHILSHIHTRSYEQTKAKEMNKPRLIWRQPTGLKGSNVYWIRLFPPTKSPNPTPSKSVAIAGSQDGDIIPYRGFNQGRTWSWSGLHPHQTRARFVPRLAWLVSWPATHHHPPLPPTSRLYRSHYNSSCQLHLSRQVMHSK